MFVRAQCHRSKRKTAPPYSVIAAVGQHGEVADGSCACPAGKVACNHLMGMLRTVALLQSKGFQEAPQHMACTDLPQQWRVPRGSAIKGSSIQGIDWQSVREGDLSVPKLARPTERRAGPRNAEQQAAAKERLCQRMLAQNPYNSFARGLLLTPGEPSNETKYGLGPSCVPTCLLAGTAAPWFQCPVVGHQASVCAVCPAGACGRTFQGCAAMATSFPPKRQRNPYGVPT